MAVIVKSGRGDSYNLLGCRWGAAALVLLLGACGKFGTGQDEMTWARAALERNAQLEVVATDPQARTFTVRLKDSGELRVIPLDQVVAGPAFRAAATKAVGEAPVRSDTASALSPAAETGAAAGATAPANIASAAATTSTPAANTPKELELPPVEAEEPPRPELAQSAAPPQQTGPHAESAADAKPGRVLASGPGYSIKASGSRGATARVSALTTSRGTPVERLHDPIICQGSRLLHIDNRNLEFDGDAVTAEDGCEIHITNTHIIAKGIGVVARAANVHIENSQIEGDSGAIDASEGAQVYAESSTFKGLTRRLESSAFHDLGGNVWN